MGAVGAVGAVGAAGTPPKEKGPPCIAAVVGPPRGEGRRAALKEALGPARRGSPFTVRAADGLGPVEDRVRVRVRVRGKVRVRVRVRVRGKVRVRGRG